MITVNSKHKITVTLIASIVGNNKIGYFNELLVRNTADLQHFKETTINRLVVMGRNTFESIGSKPLINRTNFVLTRNNNIKPSVNCGTKLLSGSTEELINYCYDNGISNIYVIGGEQIYNQFFPIADVCILTHFDSYELNSIKANRFFPKIESCWEQKKSTTVNDELFVIRYLYNSNKPNKICIR